MNILITGSSGLVGRSLIPFLKTGGHRVIRLLRSQPNSGEDAGYWNPASGEIETGGLEALDAVIHLAGESIAEGRWTVEKKARIRDSRVKGTTLLCETLSKLDQPPKALVSASAIGYYGDRGDEILSEDSEPGSDFLANVCREWEAATRPALDAGIRVVNLRIGIVLSLMGGALAKMLTPFLVGAGGVIGTGQQQMSWIAIDDLIGAIHHALITEELRGPVNATAPKPTSNREFTKTLGRVLGRPTIFPLPGFGARLVFGEMANALLLASMAVKPTRLTEIGYQFRHPDLEEALRHLLGK